MTNFYYAYIVADMVHDSSLSLGVPIGMSIVIPSHSEQLHNGWKCARYRQILDIVQKHPQFSPVAFQVRPRVVQMSSLKLDDLSDYCKWINEPLMGMVSGLYDYHESVLWFQYEEDRLAFLLRFR